MGSSQIAVIASGRSTAPSTESTCVGMALLGWAQARNDKTVLLRGKPARNDDVESCEGWDG